MLRSRYAGGSQIFAQKIVKSDHSVFAFGISARKQLEVKNMQNAKETQERMKRIGLWKYRVIAQKTRYS
jgi:hypothetical protein